MLRRPSRMERPMAKVLPMTVMIFHESVYGSGARSIASM